MPAGSTTWSSTLTRMRSSICMQVPPRCCASARAPVGMETALAREPLGGDRGAVQLGGVGAGGEPGDDGGRDAGWRARVAAFETEGPRVHFHPLGDHEPRLQVVTADP